MIPLIFFNRTDKFSQYLPRNPNAFHMKSQNAIVTNRNQDPRSKDKAPALTDCSTPQRYDRVPIDVDARNVLAFQ